MKRFHLAAFADEADTALSGQIAALSENGISHLEIRGVDGVNIADLSPEKAKDVRAKLDARGIRVFSLGSPYGKIGIDEDFAPHLEKFKRGVELADLLGAKCIRMFSFYVSEADADAREDDVMAQLSQFIAAARGSGITLCHENEKGIFGENADRCARIHRTFPEIRAVFDPANFIQAGQDTKAAWALLSPYVEYLHVKDALANGTVVPAGKGVGNLAYLLEAFGGGTLTLEPHLHVFEGLAALEADQKTQIDPYTYASNREAFDAAVNALKQLIEEIGGRYE